MAAMPFPTSSSGGDPAAAGDLVFHWYMLALYGTLALGISTLCSLTEAALLSLPRSYPEKLKQQGKSAGRILSGMKRDIDRPLAAILTLNTISHTVGAAGVGAESLVIFGDKWVAATSAVLTILILVFSEIIPKTIGAMYSRPLAGFTAYVVTLMIYGTWPVIRMLELVSRLLPKPKSGQEMTREDIVLLTEMSTLEGALDSEESQIIQNLIQLRDVTVKDIMTPRTVMATIQKDCTAAEAMRVCGKRAFSRYPVYGENSDDLIGVLLRRDLSDALHEGRGMTPVSELVRELRAVPETATVYQTLWQFVHTGHHMFHVVDEYGGTAGLVTLEDVLETMLGLEITDETDAVIDMQRFARRRRRAALAARAARSDRSDPPPSDEVTSTGPGGYDVDAAAAPEPPVPDPPDGRTA